MTATVLALVVASSMLFAALYFPAVERFSRGLSTPYAKVDIRRRFAAAAIDGMLVATLLVFAIDLRSSVFLALAIAYLLFRDAVSGQSLGKFLLGLIVIRLETGRPCNLSASATRNAVLLVPGANAVAVLLEARTIARDPLGHRLGDRMARTQVVDGLGAKELVKAVQRELASIEGSPLVRKPDRTPVGVD
jgi:uncharacterized RDD family membrane protein YckC